MATCNVAESGGGGVTAVGSAQDLTDLVTANIPPVPEGVAIIPFPPNAVSDHLPFAATFYPARGGAPFRIMVLNMLDPAYVHHFHVKKNTGQRLSEYSFASKDRDVQAMRVAYIIQLIIGWVADGYIVCLQEVPTNVFATLQAFADGGACRLYGTGFNAHRTSSSAVLVPTLQYTSEAGKDLFDYPVSRKTRHFHGVAVTDRGSGLTFHVLSVHIPFQCAKKFARAIESYSERIGGDVPLIVAGDFNTVCRAYPRRRSWRSNDHNVDAFTSPKAHFVLPDPAAGPVYTSVNTYHNAGNTTTRMLDKLINIVLYGNPARMAQTFRLSSSTI